MDQYAYFEVSTCLTFPFLNYEFVYSSPNDIDHILCSKTNSYVVNKMNFIIKNCIIYFFKQKNYPLQGSTSIWNGL